MKLINLRGSEVLPKKLPEGKHSGHTFDDDYCYDCGCIVEEDEIDRCGTNWKYNKAVSTIEQVCVEVDVEELEKILHSHFDSFFHQVHFYIEIKDWYDKGIKETAKSLNESKQKWLKLERVEPQKG